MACRREDPQGRAQPPGVFEPVPDRSRPVARSPDDERRATHVLEVGPAIVGDESLPGSRGVDCGDGAVEEAEDRLRRERLGVECPLSAESQPAVPRQCLVVVAKAAAEA